MVYFTDREFWVMRHLVDEGWTTAQIATKLKVDHKTVRYWRRRQVPPSTPQQRAVSRKASSAIEARRRRVKELVKRQVRVKGVRYTPKLRKERVRYSVRLPFQSPTRIARQLHLEFNINTSASTVRRDLQVLGFRPLVRRRAPGLTADHLVRRVAFCRKCLKEQLIFTDEKIFDSNDSGDRFQYCHGGQRPLPRETMQGPPSIMVWGAIGVGFRHLVVRDREILTKEKYQRDILIPSLPKLRQASNRGLSFMQDGARAHSGGLDFLKKRRIKVLKEPWPALSCDLNPIEQIWSRVQARVSARAPFGEEQLARFVKEEWGKIPQRDINNLCESFERRCRRVIAAKGQTIKP